MNLTIDGNHITFSSGLNRALTRSCNQINVKYVETLLQNKSVSADFQMNKTAAFCLQKISEIFDVLKTKTRLKNFDLKVSNIRLEESYSKDERTSSHYLSPFIHEIMHGVYVDYIYKKMDILQQKVFSREENEIIKNNQGLYSLSPENQYHEVFAETFTKIICNCLSPQDSLPVKNPLEEMKSLPCEFLRILAKLF